MKALQSLFLVVAVGVAAFSFLPAPAAADGGGLGGAAARAMECEYAKAAYASVAYDCVFAIPADYSACGKVQGAYDYAMSVCGAQ